MVAVTRQITTALGALGAILIFITRANIHPPGDIQAIVIVMSVYLLVYAIVDIIDALCFPTNWDRYFVLVTAPLAVLLLGVWSYTFWVGQGAVAWPSRLNQVSVRTVKGICFAYWLLYSLYDLVEALYWVVSGRVQQFPGVEWVIVTAIVAITVVIVLVFLV